MGDMTLRLTVVAVSNAQQLIRPTVLSASAMPSDVSCQDQSQLATEVSNAEYNTLQAGSAKSLFLHSKSAAQSGVFKTG